jgi:ABC-2 type transport system permease protein
MVGVNGAGINGAGVNGPGMIDEAKLGRGLLSAPARAQYAAMVRLRWRIFVNGLRSKVGAIELGARTVMNLIYASFGLGMGAGAGVIAYLLVSGGQWHYLPILFWAVCFLWQMVPVMLASFQEQFDLGILLRFPVSFGSYFLLYVVFGLADASTILGGLCCLGIWIGITLARPELSVWTALGLAVFAAFNIMLVRAVFAWIDRWLAQRKTREIVGAVFMVLILSLQLLNPALHQARRQGRMTRQERAEQTRQAWARYEPLLKTADQVQRWLPPGLGEEAIKQANNAQPAPALASLGLLGLYVLAVGMALAGRLGAEYRGENLGQAPKRSKTRQSKTAASLSMATASQGNAVLIRTNRAGREGRGFLVGSGPIAAVVEKEVRSLVRTLPLLWALGVPVLMVLILGGIFRNGPSGAASPFRFALPISVAYALLGFTQLFYNNLGAEGAGIQLLFLSPTPIRKVLLAKNLLHSLLFFLDALLAGTLSTLRLGWSGGEMAAATAAWLLFALPCNLAVGNIFSLTMPYRINPGRISRQRGSQANALFSLFIQLGVLGVGAAVFVLCWVFDKPWLAVPVFLLLAAGAFFVWLRVLGNVDAIASQRKDALIATLMKTE